MKSDWPFVAGLVGTLAVIALVLVIAVRRIATNEAPVCREILAAAQTRVDTLIALRVRVGRDWSCAEVLHRADR